MPENPPPTDTNVGGNNPPPTGSGIGFDPTGDTTTPGDHGNIEHYDKYREFLSTAKGYNVSVTDNVKQLAKEAAAKGWNTTTFMYYLRQTPEYKSVYGGTGAGSSAAAQHEAEVKAALSQYENIAAQAGVKYDNEIGRKLFAEGVSPTEFSMRAPAVGRLQRNRALFTAFKREAIQLHGVKPSEITEKNLLELAAGIGNPKFVDLWQDTVTRNAAMEAGIQIKKGKALRKDLTSIRKGLLEKISAKGLSEAEMAQGFQELAEHFLTTMPNSKLAGFKLNRRQLVAGEFGGKHQAEIRQKMKRVLETSIAQGDEQAVSAVQQNDRGGIQALGAERGGYD